MEALQCELNHSEPIIGICTDQDCYAHIRILCSICTSEYHDSCKKHLILTREQLIEQLQAKYMNAESEEQLLIQEKSLKEKLGVYAKIPFSLEIWKECYQVLASQNTVSKFTFSNTIIPTPESLESMDCSPCGKYIACGVTRDILLIDLEQQKQITQTQAHYNDVHTLKFSPNGQFIATGSTDNTIKIWEASTLIQFGKTLEGHQDSVRTIAFSPNGEQLVSGAYDQTIRIWNCANQEQIGESIKVDYYLNCVNYSPNGSQIISAGSDGNIEIWDSITKNLIMKLNAGTGQIGQALYSLDGKLIVSGDSQKKIKLFDAMSGQQIHEDLMVKNLFGYDSIFSVAISPDCKFIASGSSVNFGGGTIRIWNLASGDYECFLDKQGDHTSTVLFSKDGKSLISASNNNTITISKFENKEE